MALIEMGAIVTKIRGKVQGTVFSGNSAGNVIRNKTIPKRSSTDARSLWNNQMKYYSQVWVSLTDAQKANWALFAANFTFTNKLGANVVAAPNLVFQTFQCYYYRVNLVLQPNPPAYATPPVLTSLVATVVQAGNDAYFDFDSAPGGMYLSIFSSPPFRRGQEALMQSRLKQIMYPNQVNTTDVQAFFGPQFWAMFPYAVTGQYVWIAIRRIDATSFVWSPLQYFLVQIS